MTRAFTGAVAVAAGAVLLLGCNSGPSLDEGLVIEKVYDDPDQWYQSGQTIDGGRTCTGGYNGSPQTCFDNADTYIPGRWHYEDEEFLLRLEAPNPDKPSKPYRDTRSVPESFWDEVRVGNWVSIKAMEIIER